MISIKIYNNADIFKKGYKRENKNKIYKYKLPRFKINMIYNVFYLKLQIYWDI